MLVILLAAAAVQVPQPPSQLPQVVPVGPAAVCPRANPSLIPIGSAPNRSESLPVVVAPYKGLTPGAVIIPSAPHTLGSEPDAALCLAKPPGEPRAPSR